MRRRFLHCLLLCCTLAAPLGASAAIIVTDDARHSVTLPSPARRIVSLAPHTTEMLFAAGAGAYVVGVTEFSDYPPEAKRIPSVGNGQSLDLERILQLKPDLIVGWNNGYAGTQLGKLESLGIPVFKSEPYDFPTIASSIERLAQLAGTDAVGKAAADKFRARLQHLQASYQQRRKLTVFYQIWRAPLMTLNGKHMVSGALHLCGAENVFAGLPQLAPTVNIEAVMQADPEVLIGASSVEDDSLEMWRRFPQMKAVKNGNLLKVNVNQLNRSGPRILDGVEALCRQLDAVRVKH